jgi:cobalt-zinc-cadmium efflux system membrane fusion protein
MVEVKSGLFEGDLIVTQRAPQLYAQSLRSGSKASTGAHQSGEAKEAPLPASDSVNNNQQLPWWLIVPVAGAIAASTFWAGTLWAGRRTKYQLRQSAKLAYAPEESPTGSARNGHHVSIPDSHIGTVPVDESSQWVDNHHIRSQESQVKNQK